MLLSGKESSCIPPPPQWSQNLNGVEFRRNELSCLAEKIPRQNGVQAVELLLLIAPIKVDSEETVCRAERHDSIKCGKKRSGSEFKVMDKKSADKVSVVA